jgi:trehalose 6-phosphate phosphatase
MKYILSRDHVDVLAQLAWSRVLLAFDFDGTLAPIFPDRDRAAMRVRTRALLAAACQLYPCAVISGRARRDVATRLADATAKYVVGNHGIESGSSEITKFERAVAIVRPLLEQALAPHPGLEIEDKRYSLAIHYRRARRKREARFAIDAAVAALPRPMRVIPGKLVANVIPVGARNKGDTLLDLRARESADIALYVGDDVTDEDVFTLDQPGRLLAMRVGKTTMSAARFYLRDQGEIDSLLARLVALRKARPRR